MILRGSPCDFAIAGPLKRYEIGGPEGSRTPVQELLAIQSSTGLIHENAWMHVHCVSPEVVRSSDSLGRPEAPPPTLVPVR